MAGINLNHRVNDKRRLFLDSWIEQGPNYYIQYEYYPRTDRHSDDKNPSGNINLKAVRYVSDDDGSERDIHRVRYEYNENDDIIRVSLEN